MTIFAFLLASCLAVQPATAAARAPVREYGPFFTAPAPADTHFPSGLRRNPWPVLSVGKGQFCFVEDAMCRSSLLASADLGAGINVLGGGQRPDLPFARAGFRLGVTVRPWSLAKGRPHPWMIGVVGAWSRATGSVRVDADGTHEVNPVDSWRIGIVNQMWMSQRPHAVHLDFTLGGVRSPVLDGSTAFALWGTHAELELAFGGFGGVFLGADFLDRDLRMLVGVRGHALVAAPVVALVLLGLAAGGAL